MTDEELKALVAACKARLAEPTDEATVNPGCVPDLIAAIEYLLRERDLNLRAGKSACEQLVLAVGDRLAAEAENARLREMVETEIVQMALALRDDADEGRIKDDMGGPPWAFGFGYACNLIAKKVRSLAPRAALKGGKE